MRRPLSRTLLRCLEAAQAAKAVSVWAFPFPVLHGGLKAMVFWSFSRRLDVFQGFVIVVTLDFKGVCYEAVRDEPTNVLETLSEFRSNRKGLLSHLALGTRKIYPDGPRGAAHFPSHR